MRCPSCSTESPPGAAFCPQCGAALTQAAPAATTPADRLRAAAPPGAANNDPEQHLWRGGFSPKAMYGSWLLAALVSIAAGIACVLVPLPTTWLVAIVVVAALWTVLFAQFLYHRLSADYTLTTQRLLRRKGIFSQVTDRTEVIDIDDVQFTQGIVERMFGVGTIKLLSSDTSDPTLFLRGIDDVQRVANLIDNARREERRKRGLYMETV